MTTTAPPEADAPARRPRLTRRPAVVLAAAVVIAVVSFLVVTLRLPWPVGAVLVVIVLLATVWATLSAIARRSLFVAPLAVCILALGNPVILSGLGSYVQTHAGVITVSLDRGLVLWANYPGIAGWEAPASPTSVDTVRLATEVQNALRVSVGELSDAYGYAWSIGEGTVGIQRIPNGYGGRSLFERVDAPLWQTSDFDGSADQRMAVVQSAAAAAATLELTDIGDSDGDVDTGDGTRTWSSGDATLMLTIEGDTVSLTYTAGPYLTRDAVLGEFPRSMRGFDGLTRPAPLETPDVPERP